MVIGDLPTELIIPAGESSTTITLPTNENSGYLKNRYIDVFLESSIYYNVSDTSGNIRVDVFDRSIPSNVSIIPDTQSITEGDQLRLYVTMNPPTEIPEGLRVTLSFYEVGKFLSTKFFAYPVDFKQGQRVVQVDIDTVDDDNYEIDGSITARINGHHLYSIAPSYGYTTVQVWDNDAPTGLSIIAVEDTVTEGDLAKFRIYSDQPAAMNLDVLLDTEIQGAVFSGNDQSQVRINYLERYAEVALRTQGDNIHEIDGSITLSILPHPDYSIALEPDNSATIQVIDDDVPVGISVLPLTDSIVEGDIARFNVIADEVSSQSRIIKLEVEQGDNENFLASDGEHEVEISSDLNSGILELVTIDDEIDEAVGTVTVTILSNPDLVYEIAESPGNSASMRIEDNDASPVVSIIAGDSVFESDNAVYTLTMTNLTATDRVINLTLDQGESNFIDQSLTTYPNSTVIISAGATDVELNIPLVDDDLAEPNGEILVTLNSGEEYQIDEESNSAVVIVEDNDSIPTVSITADADQSEANSAVFNINATSKSDLDLVINFEISEELGDFLADLNPVSITLPAESLTVPINIAIVDDSEIETDGRIRVSILAGTGYEVAAQPDQSAAVNILDDDAPTGISVQAQHDSIIEGETATFQVTSSNILQESIEVNVSIDQTGNIIENSPIERVVTLDSANRIGTISVQTEADLVWEFDGVLTATITPDDNYTIAPEPAHSASIDVLDDDQPTGISIRALSNSDLVEGDFIQFEILAETPVDFTRRINLSVTETSGNFITSLTNLTPEIVLLGQRDLAYLNIDTEDDNIDEEDGQISVSILPGRGYSIAPEPANSAVVTVLDNDDNPEISIQPLVPDDIIEGSDAEFLVLVNKPVAADITVNLEISDHNSDFLVAESVLITEVVMQTGRVRELVSAATELDLVDEANGEITAEILPGNGYSIAEDPAHVASIAILDDDAIPVISIRSLNDTIYENSDVEFLLSSPTASPVDLILDVSLTKTGDFFENIPDDTVILRAKSLETSINVEVDNDQVEETQSGLVVAEINPGAGYVVADTPENRAEVIIEDDDIPPVITISRVSESPIVEGADGIFRISAEPIPQEDINVVIVVDEIGGLEAGGNGIERTEVIASGQSSHDFTITTASNNIDESLKRILVLLKPVTPQSNYSIGVENTAQINVVDSDLPEISITGGETVIEGNSAQFTIVSNIARDSALVIHYTVSEGDSSFLRPTQVISDTIVMRPGSTEDHTELFIETISDSISKADGEVVVALLGDVNSVPRYRISDSLNQAIVIVQDQSIPSIAVTGGDSIVESATAEFTISANIIRERDLQVRYSVSDGTGNFLTESQLAIDETTLAAGDINETVSIMIATESDIIDEFDGEITVTILPDDATEPEYLVDLLQPVAIVSVADDDIPEISITGGTLVDEGNIITFNVLTDIDRENDLAIHYDIIDSANNFVEPTFATEGIIPLEVDSVSVPIFIPTENDMVDKVNGEVTVALQLNENIPEQYRINPNFDQATVQVRDNDIPEISIIESNLISEGTEAEFVISSDIASDRNQLVEYRVDYFIGETLDQSKSREEIVTLLAGGSNRTATIVIDVPENQGLDEYTSILVTIHTDPDSELEVTYLVSSNYGVASVNISDEDQSRVGTHHFNFN